MAEKIPSPTSDRMNEALNNPTQFRRQVIEQEQKIQQQGTSTSVRPTDAPAAPDINSYLRKDK